MTPHGDYAEFTFTEEGERAQLNDSLLQIENEFYSPIRPKRVTASGEAPVVALRRDGIEYVEVRCIDIHPLLLTEEWSGYADHVLFHEYLHALLPGVGHGPEFRALESLWPDKGAIEKKAEFGQFIRERRSDILKWELKCPSCGERYLRKEPMPGARCGRCKTVLDNIER